MSMADGEQGQGALLLQEGYASGMFKLLAHVAAKAMETTAWITSTGALRSRYLVIALPTFRRLR